MMDISFLSPIEFSLNVIDIDDHVPSLCMLLNYSYSNDDISINGRDKFWFLKSDWLSFVSPIRNTAVKDITSAQLVDMERNFRLSIYRRHEIIFFQLRHHYRNYYTDKLSSLNIFRVPIDFDLFSHITQPFLDFPIWR